MVGEVERFRADLQVESLTDFGVLDHGKIDIDGAGRSNVRQC
jgi:hypothetical protein